MNHTRQNDRRGANAIEFALTFPVFIMILMGFIDFGAYFSGLAIADNITAQTCRDAALLDSMMEDVALVAEERMMARAEDMPFLSCGAACVAEATIEGAPPSAHLVCRLTLDTQSLTGMTPIPDAVSSASMARLEWQR
jgi:hypothetical protein